MKLLLDQMNNKLLKHITTNDSLCINYLIPKLSMLQSHAARKCYGDRQ